MYDGLWGDAACERDGMEEVIDWVAFEALWACSLDGQAQRVQLNGANDDVTTFTQLWKSIHIKLNSDFAYPDSLS